jgi:hypothetical protein
MKWVDSHFVMLSIGEWPMALCQLCLLITGCLILRSLFAGTLFSNNEPAINSTDEPASKDTAFKAEETREVLVAEAKYSMGSLVRAKRGTMDPERADFSVGGWTGTIDGIGPKFEPRSGPLAGFLAGFGIGLRRVYLVRWNQETLDQMPTAYRKSCQEVDLEVGRIWLGEDDLESP